MTIKSLVLALSLFAGSLTLATAQAGLTPAQVSGITSALQRIALSNNLVEKVIYDGMTFGEVQRILNQPSLGIVYDVGFDGLAPHSYYYSVVGRYRIYWSTPYPFQSPVVVGYSLASDTNILHNQVP